MSILAGLVCCGQTRHGRSPGFLLLCNHSFFLCPFVLSLSDPAICSVASSPVSIVVQEPPVLTQKCWGWVFHPNFLHYTETSIPLSPLPRHTTKALQNMSFGNYITLFGFQWDNIMTKRIPHWDLQVIVLITTYQTGDRASIPWNFVANHQG